MRRQANKRGAAIQGAPRRASFPEDSLPQGRQDAWTSAEGMFINHRNTWQGAPQQPVQEADPWDGGFVPAAGGWYAEDEATLPQVQTAGPAIFLPYEPAPAAPALDRPRGSLFFFLAALLSFALIAACAVNVLQAYQNQPAFQSKLKQMQGPGFAAGTSIDGLDVSGKTPEQVRQLAGREGFGAPPQVAIRLVVDQTAYQFDNSHLPFERNIETVMETAWSIGRQGSHAMLSTDITPFEYRWRHRQQVARQGVALSTRVSYKPEVVEELALGIAAQVSREPVNAVISSFDFNTKVFTVTQDVPGRSLDPQLVSDALKQALDRQDYQASIALQSTPVLPRVSSVSLRNGFTQLAVFNTKTTSDSNRNNNIALAAQAINNRTLMPGEAFSFNEATGQRTMDKGYRGAPAIQGGVLIDDVGGGVCQVSSTLFYAAAAAGLEIVERSPHAWPVSYMDKGLDATVNWPNLDFKFKNNKDTPVFIIASFEKRTLTIEFYGMLSAPGEGIRLETQLMATIQPPNEPLLQQNPQLPFGSRQELKPARTGYTVDTYRVYTRNGQEYRREKLFTSKYRMVQQVIEYN